MANVADANAVEEKKVAVADKSYIDAAGLEVSIDKATGLKYVSLADKRSTVYTIPDAELVGAGHPMLMLALFGATTLATNKASANRGAIKRGDEDVYASDIDAIVDRFAGIVQGDWGVERGGGLGAGIDHEVLLAAMHEAAPAKATDPARVQRWKDAIATDSAFRRTMRNHDDIKPIYDRLMAEKKPKAPSKPLDELLD